MQVQNHNIVVTGAAGGLGGEVARGLAAAGATVALVDLNEAGAAAVELEIKQAGGRAISVCGDLTRKAPARDLFRRAVSGLGRINGLVNCAGVYPRRPILEISDDDWDFSFSVNVRGLYHMSVAAVEHMQQAGGGRIVNVASIDAFKAHPKNAHYAAMKAAVVSLTKSMGEAAAPGGVLVNGVAPGAIATDKAKASGFLKEVIADTPIGFAAEPRDIADVIQFLVSEQNRFMVGETVVVSGGYFIP